LREHGELTPAQAAMETSLSVTEADRMLKELAEGGGMEGGTRGIIHAPRVTVREIVRWGKE
jgi:hypothetical protein